MEQQKVISLLKSVIKTRRNEVIKALQDATVVLPYNFTDEDLLQTILKELRNDNGYLVYHLGRVIDNFFDATTEKKSNWVAAAIGVGSQLLGSLMGGKGDDGKAMAKAQLQAAQAEAKRQEALQKQMLIAASEAEAERLRSEAMIKKRKASTQRTVITISLIGGTLIIGGIVAYFALRTKPKTK